MSAIAGVAELLRDLDRPDAYPHPVGRVQVLQTHISLVFLAGDEVFKLKKPLDLGFLDYSTLAKRRTCCEEEVRLNRRLAPDVYLGVVAVTEGPDGRLRIGGDGPPVEYAVRMRRLPRERTLRERVRADDPDLPTAIRRVAERLARFHRDADRGPHVDPWGRYAVLRRNVEENFEQTRPFVGRPLEPETFEALERETLAAAKALRPAIEARCAEGRTCEGHGDLRLEHVYWFPDRDPADALRIIDGIEFNRRFRYADPALDLAFLAMDLTRVGRRDLAELLVEAWCEASDDPGARALMPLYVAYRATVRAKVACFLSAEEEVAAAERQRAEEKARALFQLALEELRGPTDVTAGSSEGPKSRAAKRPNADEGAEPPLDPKIG